MSRNIFSGQQNAENKQNEAFYKKVQIWLFI